MKVKVLTEHTFRVLAVMDGDGCPAEDFILEGDKGTQASREGLMEILGHVAEKGLQNVPSAWFHEADKAKGIYEFIKGPLRLFFFKGQGNDIAVCTAGIRKKADKADKKSVNKADAWRNDYFAAIDNTTLEVVEDETE